MRAWKRAPRCRRRRKPMAKRPNEKWCSLCRQQRYFGDPKNDEAMNDDGDPRAVQRCPGLITLLLRSDIQIGYSGTSTQPPAVFAGESERFDVQSVPMPETAHDIDKRNDHEAKGARRALLTSLLLPTPPPSRAALPWRIKFLNWLRTAILSAPRRWETGVDETSSQSCIVSEAVGTEVPKRRTLFRVS